MPIQHDQHKQRINPATRHDRADLYTAIRCYVQVPKKYRPTDRVRTKLYLSGIMHRRGFMYDNENRTGIDIFCEYLDNPRANLTNTAE